MLFGLGLGLIVAAGVYLRGGPDGDSAAARAPAEAPAAAEPAAAASEPAAAARAAPEPAPPSPEARFEFYEILPQFEVVVPEVETPARRAAAPRAVVQEPGSYVLQAGSFNSVGDADRRKASLALLGVESRIQRVEIDDNVFHRVRVGPIEDLNELNRIRGRLRDNNIETMVMKASN